MHKTLLSLYIVYKKNKTLSTLLVFLCLTTYCFSQNKEQTFIKINGKVIDKQALFPSFKLMVINAHTNTGVMGSPTGEFNMYANKSDTLLISANGYKIKKVCLKDSVSKMEYNLNVDLEKREYTPKVKAMHTVKKEAINDVVRKPGDTTELKDRIIYLKPIPVFAVKKLDEIQKDISKIGSRQEYSYNHAATIESPVTYLYEAFSKIERSKRIVAALEDEDYKKSVLKDLFRIYIQTEIINLSEDEFDNFIWFCNLPDEFIKNASPFELVKAIKERYEVYSQNKK